MRPQIFIYSTDCVRANFVCRVTSTINTNHNTQIKSNFFLSSLNLTQFQKWICDIFVSAPIHAHIHTQELPINYDEIRSRKKRDDGNCWLCVASYLKKNSPFIWKLPPNWMYFILSWQTIFDYKEFHFHFSPRNIEIARNVGEDFQQWTMFDLRTPVIQAYSTAKFFIVWN